MAPEIYSTTCWNCLGEFDALTAVWCADDPKNPTKLCPFCFHCFCDASEKYKQEFWRKAPPRLQEELATLNKSKDRLGDLLIRMGKITTSQLLEALVEQKSSGKRLGEILVARGLVTPEDVAAALRTQGVNPLTDTMGVAYASSTVWEHSSPEAIVQYILSLAARKGASDTLLEPKPDGVAVKYRIDGFSFRVDPIPKKFQAPLTRQLFDLFGLDPAAEGRPQHNRITMPLQGTEYDLIVQTLPTTHGVSTTVKLVNRATFLKDLTTLGLELEDRVRLMEQLRSSFGLVLITAPVFNGANSTSYSLLSFLARGQREVVSLESPILWNLDGVRQVEVPEGSRMEEALRSVVAVRPDALVLSDIPDRPTALLAAQLASSILVLAVMPAQSTAQALTALLQTGVSPQLLAGCLSAVTCQRLIRQICRICRKTAEAPATQTLAYHGIGAEEAARLRFFKGQGCPTCNKVGYRGRRAIFEVLNGAPEVRTAVLSGSPHTEIESVAVAAGMTTLRDRCLALVREGATTFEEFVRLRL